MRMLKLLKDEVISELWSFNDIIKIIETTCFLQQRRNKSIETACFLQQRNSS